MIAGGAEILVAVALRVADANDRPRRAARGDEVGNTRERQRDRERSDRQSERADGQACRLPYRRQAFSPPVGAWRLAALLTAVAEVLVVIRLLV